MIALMRVDWDMWERAAVRFIYHIAHSLNQNEECVSGFVWGFEFRSFCMVSPFKTRSFFKYCGTYVVHFYLILSFFRRFVNDIRGILYAA